MRLIIRKSEFHPDQYREYLEKHYRHNLIVNVLDVSFFWFAMSVVSVAVILPAFCARLGASNALIGFLQAVGVIGWFLPQLFVSFYVEGLFRKKPFVLFFGIFQRLPWICLGIFTLILLPGHPTIMLVLVFSCYITASLAGGVSATAWGEMIAKAIPQKLRGFFMGMIQLSGNGLAIVGGLIVKFVMEGGRFSFPDNYAVLFFCASAILILSYLFFILNREPILLPAENSKRIADYFRGLPAILKNDRNFAFFILSRILGHSNVMSMAFFMVYTMKRFNMDDTISGNFVLASTIATMVASVILGKIADRTGHKTNLVISRLLHMAAPLLAIVAWTYQVMYVVFILMAIGMASFMISMSNIIFEFAPEGKRPTYMGLGGTLSAPFIIIFSIVGGIMADHPELGYHLPFAVSIVLNFISAVVLVVFVKDPRKLRRT